MPKPKITIEVFYIFGLVYLSGGRGPWEGTINVYHNNQWGTVCDDAFGKSDADVICRMLGYSGSVVFSLYSLDVCLIVNPA